MNNNNQPKCSPDSLSSAPSSPNHSLIPTQILSQTPGRIRMRVASSNRRTEQIKTIVAELKNQLAIDKVQPNFQSGTITVLYNNHSLNSTNILDQLLHLGVRFSDITRQSLSLTPTPSTMAIGVSQVTQDFNQRIKQASDGMVDLGFLFPLSLALLAWRQLMVKGWQLDMIPWYVLAWYSFDSFIKFQGTHQKVLDNQQPD